MVLWSSVISWPNITKNCILNALSVMLTRNFKTLIYIYMYIYIRKFVLSKIEAPLNRDYINIFITVMVLHIILSLTTLCRNIYYYYNMGCFVSDWVHVYIHITWKVIKLTLYGCIRLEMLPDCYFVTHVYKYLDKSIW